MKGGITSLGKNASAWDKKMIIKSILFPIIFWTVTAIFMVLMYKVVNQIKLSEVMQYIESIL